jgi:selenocysteine lyase/cysteine desulfurase
MEKMMMILKLFPLVLEAVRNMESALPNGCGLIKLEAAVQKILALNENYQEIEKEIRKMVNIAVEVMNKSGAFQKQ